ncbi:hypothetical protein B1810_16820 [Panacagrimonas perspica]|nr:hypothetical protein B1810_16820 [Panacagrimonas perspica]
MLGRAKAIARSPTEEGRQFIERLLASPPARRARRSKFNGVVRTASEQTGRTQEAESDSNEGALHLECEFNRELLTWKAQPVRISVDYLNSEGRRIVTKVTPDAFVQFLDGSAAFIEMATDEEASDEATQGNPHFAPDGESGRYLDRPLLASCEPLGIGVLLATTRDVSAVLTSNLLFFGKGFRTRWKMADGARRFIIHVQRVGVTRYCDVVLQAENWTADDVIGCIVNEHVYVDLLTEQLQPYGVARIFASRDLWEAARAAPVEAPALTEDRTGKEQFDFSAMSKASELEMYRRYGLIREALADEKLASSLPDLERAYLRLYREAVSKYGAGLVGLCPDFGLRGFHGSHLPEKTEAILCEHIDARAENRPSKTPWTYGKFIAACEAENTMSPSHVTYGKRWNERKAQLDAIEKNEGSGAAYQKSPAVAFTIGTVSRIATRAFSIGIIDHTPIPIRCITSFTGVPLPGLSPILSLMRDEGTHETLASTVSFDKPSNRTIDSLFWDCYRRHGKLTDRMKMDGESSHDSVNTEQSLARMTSDKVARRYSNPRDGQVVEGSFSWLMRGLFVYLAGNYVKFQDPKEWPKGWDPANFADRTIASLLMVIEAFLYDFANTRIRRSALAGQTPAEARATSERIHGDRSFRLHPDLDQARYILLPYCPTNRLEFDRQTGFRCLGEPYVPLGAVDPAFYGAKHAVKYDPFDVSYVIARLGRSWTELKHRAHKRFSSLRGIELAAVSLELRAAHTMYAKSNKDRAREHALIFEKIAEISKDPLADFHTSLANCPTPGPSTPSPPTPLSSWSSFDVESIPASPARRVDEQ